MGEYDIQQQIRKDKDTIWAKVKRICGLYQAYVTYLPKNLRLILKPTISLQFTLHRGHIPSFSIILQIRSFCFALSFVQIQTQEEWYSFTKSILLCPVISLVLNTRFRVELG